MVIYSNSVLTDEGRNLKTQFIQAEVLLYCTRCTEYSVTVPYDIRSFVLYQKTAPMMMAIFFQ
jgi:hypothetical protein